MDTRTSETSPVKASADKTLLIDATLGNHDAHASDSIWGLSFQGLLWTNWLTAINDNISRWFVIGLGKQFYAPDQHGWVLAVGTACFVLPYLLFAVPAGWLADRFSKRQVIVACKYAEIVIMALAVYAVYLQSFPFLLCVVFLMGAQSALFAPAKVGTIPELLDEHKISAGNGLFNLSTLSATVIGMTIGGWLTDNTGYRGQDNLLTTATILVGIAVIGTIIGLFVRRMPAANPTLAFPWNIPAAMYRDFAQLLSNGRLFRVALGVVFFWAFAALVQVNIDAFVDESGAASDSERTPMLVAMVLGVGFGSVLAGFASRGKIELGLVPWAAIGMAVFCFALCLTPQFFMFDHSPAWQQFYACVGLALLGVAGGFYDVPMASYLQENSPPESRGAILASCNFMLFAGVLLVTGLAFQGLRTPRFEPSLAGLPNEFQVDQLTSEHQKVVSEAVNDFLENQQSPQVADDLKAFVSGVPEAVRKPALARLLFESFQRRGSSNEDLAPYFTAIEHSGAFAEMEANAVSRRLVKVVSRGSSKQPLASSRLIFLLMGLVTIPVAAYTVIRLSRSMATIGFYWLVRLIYRIRIRGLENVPKNGPVVFIANHSSWIDATLMMLATEREVRPIAWAGNFNRGFMKWFANFAGVILISGGPKSIVKGLRDASQVLDEGGVVGIFPEGGLSRTVQVKSFKPGIMKIIGNRDVPILPMYIDEVWGSIFSYSGGKAIFKWPRYFRKGISVHIGQPMVKPESVYPLRQQVQLLGADAVPNRVGTFETPAGMFIAACKRRLFRFKAGDSTGQKLTGGSLLMRTLILRRLLRKHVLKRDETNVGVLIPPSVGGVVVNMALALDRRVSANLNYSVSAEIMDHCIQDAGLKHILTTDKVLEKLPFELGDRKASLDTLKDKVSLIDKIVAATQAYLVPAWLLGWSLGLGRLHRDDVLTLIFTSGSTGMPKGVMLTQQNIASNVLAIEQVVCLNSDDVIVGVLPFFHSFGYTVSLWGAMALDISGAYHFSPLDVKQVGKLVESYQGTLLLATPTFLRNYLKRCTPEEFKSLQIVVVGAEKMPIELAEEFEKKFGVRPTEGYGATELSPLVSVNVPDSRRLDTFQVDCKEGTVGRPVPNVAAKVTDLETGEILGEGQAGMLWIKGPNVMKGYLNQPEKTADVIVDGWYKTGDVGLIDGDGFIKLTGRMSRFSKIGGEMVPHVTIEDELMRILGDNDGDPNIAVTAVPDSRKGERLVVLYTHLSKTTDELRSGLSAVGLPNLFIPSNDSFVQVEKLPVLGTGKIDLKGIKDLALKLFPEA